MKNSKFCFVLPIMALMVSSCTKSVRNIEIVDESNVPMKNIELQKLNLDETPLAPQSLCFVDTFMVVFEDEQGRTSNFISVYSNNKLIKKFGSVGRGPTDLLLPRSFSEGRCEHKYLRAGGSGKTIKYDIDSLIYSNKLVYVSEELPKAMELCNNMLIDNDSLWVAFRTSEYQLSFYNKRNDSMTGYANFDKSHFGDQVTDFIYNMQVCPATYTSNDEVIIIAYNMQKGIDIVSNTGELKRRLRFEDYDGNINKMRIDKTGNIANVFYNDDANVYFYDACAVDDGFYAFSLDTVWSPETKTKVFKFDWNGNLQLIYKLNKFVRGSVVYDGKIYGITLATEENEDSDFEIFCAEL